MKTKTKTYLHIIGAALLLVIGLIYLLNASDSQSDLLLNENDLDANTLLQSNNETPVTIPMLESDVELGTDGVVTTVNVSGVANGEPALVTIRTDANTLYTLAIPVNDLSSCEAAENIADVYGLVPGDKISVRGITDAEGRVVTCASEFHQLKARGTYQNAEAGLSFNYKKSPDGYLLQTEGYEFSSDSAFITGVVLTDEKEAAELLSSTVPREGPPTIKILAYENPDELTPLEWAKANPAESSHPRALAEETEIAVGRADAIGYTIDGLYLTDVYVVSFNKKALIIKGEYVDFESEIFKDLEQLVATIVFTE